MHEHPGHDNETEPSGRDLKRVLIVVAVVAALVLMVVLHLTGAIGANSH